MNDLISRQAAIDVLEWFDQTDPLGHTPAQIVRALPTAEPEPCWIPCSERLPSNKEHVDDMVLVCYGNGSIRFNTCINGNWVQGNPIAWMPLEEPYREESDETTGRD